MKLLNAFPPKIQLWMLIMGGVFCGLVLYVFYVSHVYSYFSDDPKACVNCYLMAPEFATWQHSAHREFAVCNDSMYLKIIFLINTFLRLKMGYIMLLYLP
ncbi:MAG: hypothetical protein ACRC0A_06850 [Chitinophagaceae bacterium]